MAVEVMLEEMARWAPVAHTCNLATQDQRDQEDHSWRPAQANSS
jgi:hypothetical protein